MKLKKKIFRILILLVAGFSVSASAQERLSLEDLVQQALQENYQLQIVRNYQRLAENQETPGNAGMLPTVGVRADRSWSIFNTEQNFFSGDTRSGSNARNTALSALVELDWMVFDGFSMFARRDRLGYLADMGRLEARYYIEQTVSDLAQLYYRIITEKRLLESYEQTLEVSRFRLGLESQKRKLGSGNALFYHQAVIDFNADSALVSNQQMIIRDLQIRINRIINQDPDYNVQPADEMIDSRGIDDINTLLEKSLRNNYGLERARLEEMLAEANTRVEKGNRYPSLSIFGNYALNRQTSELGFIESSQNYGTQFGLRIRFNLYDGGRQNTRITNILIEQESANIQTDDTRAFIHSELSRMINQYENYRQQYQLLEQSLDAAHRSLVISREQLQTGAINGYEYRQTQLAALRLENQLIQLTLSLKLIETDIHRISGEIMKYVM